jgi:hypothetical protein
MRQALLQSMYPCLRGRYVSWRRSAGGCVTIETAMSADRPPNGFEESSSEELERSMEQEVEGLLELDDLDFNPDGSEQITADLLRAERAWPARMPDRPGAVNPRRSGGSGGLAG